MKNATVPVVAFLAAAGLTLAPAPVAGAATAVMDGSFGAKPNYQTITAPGGGNLAGKDLVYNTWPASWGINSAYAAQGSWLDTIAPGDNTLVTYSLSTHATVGRLREDPESLAGVRVIMFGAPESPQNGNQGLGYGGKTGLPTRGDLTNVTLVVVQYDNVADKPQHPNFWTMINTSSAIHTSGYNGRDLNSPDATYVDPVTGTTTLYYRTDVLPMLRWMDWFTSDEKMAELDAKYRPRVEAGYDRPGDVDEQLATPSESRSASRSQDEEDSWNDPGGKSSSAGTSAVSGPGTPDNHPLTSQVGDEPGTSETDETPSPSSQRKSPEPTEESDGDGEEPADLDAAGDEDAEREPDVVERDDQVSPPVSVGGTGSDNNEENE